MEGGRFVEIKLQFIIGIKMVELDCLGNKERKGRIIMKGNWKQRKPKYTWNTDFEKWFSWKTPFQSTTWNGRKINEMRNRFLRVHGGRSYRFAELSIKYYYCWYKMVGLNVQGIEHRKEKDELEWKETGNRGNQDIHGTQTLQKYWLKNGFRGKTREQEWRYRNLEWQRKKRDNKYNNNIVFAINGSWVTRSSLTHSLFGGVVPGYLSRFQ